MSHASPFSELFNWLLDQPEDAELNTDTDETSPSLRPPVILGPVRPLDSETLTPPLDEESFLAEGLELPEGWLHFEAWAIREHQDIHCGSGHAIEAYLHAQRSLGVDIETLKRRLEDIEEVHRRFGTADETEAH